MTPPPINPSAPTPASDAVKLFKELCIFFLFLGVLLAVAAYFTLTGLGEDAPPLWGFSRHLALGVPLALLAGLHLLCGVTFAVLRTGISAVFGAIASTLIPVLFFALMITTTGEFPLSPIALVIAAIPVVVWMRVSKYLSAKRTLFDAASNPTLPQAVP